MAAPLRTLLVLTLTTGIQSITTVREVSVKAGASVSVPCLYSTQYRNHVKYLCEGHYWDFCSYAVKTNRAQSSSKYSISDDKNKGIFIVTINRLTDENSDFWCAVEINNGVDVRQYFHLSVTTGPPSLSVDNQEVTGYIGGNITINCNYRTSGGSKWCKLGSTCVTEGSGSIDGTTVIINSGVDQVFSVTLSGLRPESSGWYYCVRGDFQMPVHLSVKEKPAVVVTSTAVTETERMSTVKSEQNSSSVYLKNLLIPLSVLIFIIVVALFVWFLLKREHANADSATSNLSEREVTYNEVHFKTRNLAQGLRAESDADVTYSSVVLRQ